MNPYCPLHLEFIFTWNKLLLIQYYYWQVQLLPILNYFIARLINVFLFSPSLSYLYNFYYQETFSSLAFHFFSLVLARVYKSTDIFIEKEHLWLERSISAGNNHFSYRSDRCLLLSAWKKMRCWHWIPWKTLFDYFSDFVVEKDTESMSFMCGRSLRECSL